MQTLELPHVSNLTEVVPLRKGQLNFLNRVNPWILDSHTASSHLPEVVAGQGIPLYDLEVAACKGMSLVHTEQALAREISSRRFNLAMADTAIIGAFLGVFGPRIIEKILDKVSEDYVARPYYYRNDTSFFRDAEKFLGVLNGGVRQIPKKHSYPLGISGKPEISLRHLV
jgi:hypothetical protein